MSAEDEKTIAFILYPGLTPLDLIGPLQPLSGLRRLVPQWKTVVVGERIEPMGTDAGLSMTPEASFEDVPNPNIFVVPGGGAPTIKQMGNDVLLEYVRRAAEGAEIVASVCTGSLILASAGLLDGRNATTHWAYHTLLERLGVTYLPERWVEDGKFVMSAGVSAGIDMALHLIARLTGEKISRLVQLGIEYDPHPPYGGIDWSTVDRDMLYPLVSSYVDQELVDRPELQNRLLNR